MNNTDLINIKMEPQIDIKDYIDLLPADSDNFQELIKLIKEARFGLENLEESDLRSLLIELPDCNLDAMIEHFNLIESILRKKQEYYNL